MEKHSTITGNRSLRSLSSERMLVPRKCKLREKIHHIDEIGQDEWYELRCAFTRVTCCEVMGIYCPIWKIVNEGTYEP